MNKKKVNVLSASAVTAICIAAFSTTVSAAQYDYTNTKTNKVWDAATWRGSDAVKAQLVDDLINTGKANFKYEGPAGKFYAYDKLVQVYSAQLQAGKSKTEAFAAAIADPSAIYPTNPQQTNLTVSSVSAITKTTVKVTFNRAVASSDTAITSLTLVSASGKEVSATGTPVAGATDATYTFATPLSEAGVYTIKGTTLSGNYVVQQPALVVATDKTSYTADGKQVMVVTATLNDADGNPVTNFTGTAQFVSDKGLTSAQAQKSFENGKVTFNVTVPSYVIDVQDHVSVKINYAEDHTYDNLVSAPVAVTYTKSVQGGDTQHTVAYPVKVDHGTYDGNVVTDRVAVYVDGVAPTDLETVKTAIKNQLKVANALNQAGTDLVNEIKIVQVIAQPIDVAKGSYVFYALTELPSFKQTDYNLTNYKYIKDNQFNYYKIDASNTNVGLATVQATALNTATVDKVKPSILSVKVPKAADPDYLPQLTLMAKFTEPIDVKTAQNVSNWRINGHTLTQADGVDIRVLDAADNLDLADADWSTWATVLNGKKITDYKAFTEEVGANRERSLVIFKLSPSFIAKYMEAGQNIIQANSIVDWAGNTDVSDNNKVNTDNFYFNYEIPTARTGLTIAVDSSSPEQFKLKLLGDLYSDANATAKIDLANPAFKSNIYVGLVEADETKYATDGRIKSTNVNNTIITLKGTDYTIVKDPEDATGYGYLLELNNDWTQFLTYDNKSVGDLLLNNKFFAGKRLVVAINGKAYDVTGKEIDVLASNTSKAAADVPAAGAATVKEVYDASIVSDVKLAEDTTSPTVLDTSWFNADKDGDGKDIVDGKVGFKMSEPVQMYRPATSFDVGTTDATGALITAQGQTVNFINPGVTQSIQQQNGDGVPVPTFEYRKGDLRIDGLLVKDNAENEADKTFVVAPDVNGDGKYDPAVDKLEAGDWTLLVRSISDDYGNTSVTASHTFTVTAAATPVATSIDPTVTWAYADDNAVDANGNIIGDYVYILYSKKMNPSVLDAATYEINGKQLTQDAEITAQYLGSTNTVTTDAAVQFYGSDYKGEQAELVTIKLPKDFIIGGDDLQNVSQGDTTTTNSAIRHSVLTLPNTLTARDGSSLKGELQLELIYDGKHLGSGATVDTKGVNLPSISTTDVSNTTDLNASSQLLNGQSYYDDYGTPLNYQKYLNSTNPRQRGDVIN